MRDELPAVRDGGGIATYNFLYRCPTTGYKVQGAIHAPAANDTSTYESVTCVACGRVHLVNPSNGHVAGTDVIATARKA
jgi:hypothetical protein